MDYSGYGISRKPKLHNNWILYIPVAFALFVAAIMLGVRASGSPSYLPDMTPVHNNSSLQVSSNKISTSLQGSDSAIESPLPAPASSDNATSSDTDASNNTTQVTVNGQAMDVPENGTVNQTVTNDDGSTTQMTLENNTSSTEGTKSRSTTRLKISSDSTIKQKTTTPD